MSVGERRQADAVDDLHLLLAMGEPLTRAATPAPILNLCICLWLFQTGKGCWVSVFWLLSVSSFPGSCPYVYGCLKELWWRNRLTGCLGEIGGLWRPLHAER